MFDYNDFLTDDRGSLLMHFFDSLECYQNNIQHFINCLVRNNAESGIVDVDDAVTTD